MVGLHQQFEGSNEQDGLAETGRHSFAYQDGLFKAQGMYATYFLGKDTFCDEQYRS